jgi:hypothetical protein
LLAIAMNTAKTARRSGFMSENFLLWTKNAAAHEANASHDQC